MQVFMELMRQLHVLMHVKRGLPSNCFPLLPPAPTLSPSPEIILAKAISFTTCHLLIQPSKVMHVRNRSEAAGRNREMREKDETAVKHGSTDQEGRKEEKKRKKERKSPIITTIGSVMTVDSILTVSCRRTSLYISKDPSINQ